MLTLRIDLADVKLPKSSVAELQDCGGFAHRGIHLASMSDIKAQRRTRKGLEHLRQMSDCLAHRLSLVHVLDAEEISEMLPSRKIVHCIWMDNDRPSTEGDLVQGVDGNGLEVAIHNTRCVEGLVLKLSQIQVVQIPN